MAVTNKSQLEILQQAQDATTGFLDVSLIDGAAGVLKAAVTAANALKVDPSGVTQPVSGTVTANAGSGTFATKETVAATSTITRTTSTTLSVTIVASNANRLTAAIFNESTSLMYLKFGATATNTSYTVQLASNAYYELPAAHTYTGVIDGIWVSANGAAMATELTT